MKKNESELEIVKWTWEDVQNAVDRVIDKLFEKSMTGYLGVAYIPNGGALPAYLISRGIGKHGRIKSLRDNPKQDGKWIIVDEICDSGKTMATVKVGMPNCTYCCLIGTSKARVVLGEDVIFGTQMDGKWIQFPWEDDNEEKP